MGNSRNKPKVLPWIAWYFNMAHQSMIWWFIFFTCWSSTAKKNNHQRAQVWIQHQKCTNRAFYIKSLIKKKYHVKILIWDPCRFVLLGKEIFLGSMGNLRNKPKVLPWIAWYFNMAHRSMIWWFIFFTCWSSTAKKNNHQRAQVWIQHQKCTNRAFYIKSLIKKKYHVKILIWDPCRFVLLGKEIFLGSMGNSRNKPKVLPWIAWYFNMAHQSMIWWFIFFTCWSSTAKKNNHQRAQVWIQHQKCTNRAFYIKSLIKKKYHVKILIWDPCRFVLLGKEIFLGSMGNSRNKPKVLPWIAWYFNMAHQSMIWWFIFFTCWSSTAKKNNHQRAQVWIQHQKCTTKSGVGVG